MPDPRKPDVIVTIPEGEGTARHKFELFASYQFKNADMVAQRQFDERDIPTVRVRHNGVWLPPGERHLMTLRDATLLMETVLADRIKRKIV